MRLSYSILILFFAGTVLSQTVSVINYAETAGIARADVRALYQDSRGILWVGTKGAGLYQFNQGRFHRDIDMVTNLGYEVNGITEDNIGALYFWSSNGIHKYDGYDYFEVTTADPAITGISFCADSFWVATQNGLFYGADQAKILSAEISCVACTETEEIIAVSRDSLWVIRDDNILSYQLPASTMPWTSLATTGSGDVWLANTAGSLLHFVMGSSSIYETGLNIHALQTTSGGQIWLGTHHGLQVFTGDDAMFYPVNDAQSMLQSPIHAMTFDDSDRLWLGSGTFGLMQYMGNKVLSTPIVTGEGIRLIQSDPATAELWYLDKDEVLRHLTQEGDASELEEPDLRCTYFYLDLQRRRWVARGSGGVSVEFDDGQSLHMDSVLGMNLPDVVGITGDGIGTVWLETATQTLVKLGFQKTGSMLLPVWDAQEITMSVTDEVVALIARDDQSLIRIGSRSVGIARHGLFETLIEAPFNILSASLDQEGILWLGTTTGGVHFLDLATGGVLRQLIAPYALQPYDIEFVYAERKALWIATDRSILHLKLNDVRDRVTEVSEVLTMPQGTFTSERFEVTPDNAIVVLTDHELFQLNLDAYTPAVQMPHVFVREVLIDQVTMTESEHRESIGAFGFQRVALSIPFRQNSMAFTVQGISGSEEPLELRWRLEPLYPEWSDASGRTEIQFAGLPPGSYSFDVKVCDNRGKCNQLQRTWDFEVRKSLRHRWPFWAGVAVLLGFMIWLIIRQREKRIRKEAEAEKARLAAELQALTLEQKALRLQMNPHFMFNAMQTIQQQVKEGQLDTARTNLGRFAQLMRKTLSMSREEEVSLEDEIEYLRAYLAVEQICSPNPMECSINVDPDLELFAMMIPPMLFQPVLENAVKHGSGNPRAKIEVEFKETPGKLHCTIRDNGFGFPEKNKIAGDSAALEILGQRLAQYGTGARLEMNNIRNDEGGITGAEVTIVIPLDPV